MKIFLIFLFLLFSGKTLFAKNYECIGKPSQPVIKLYTEIDNSQQYIKGDLTWNAQIQYVKGDVTWSLELPDSAIVHGRMYQSPESAERIYIVFNPAYWHESDINIYGRISKNGTPTSIFDIYVRGMRGSIVDTLVDYTCSQMSP